MNTVCRINNRIYTGCVTFIVNCLDFLISRLTCLGPDAFLWFLSGLDYMLPSEVTFQI